MPTGNIFIAVHSLNWLESEEGKKKENGMFTQMIEQKISKHQVTEQTHRKYDLPTLGRAVVLEFILKWEEVLTDSGVLNPSLSKSFSLDSWKGSIECKGQGLLELAESENEAHVNRSSKNQQ